MIEALVRDKDEMTGERGRSRREESNEEDRTDDCVRQKGRGGRWTVLLVVSHN